MMSPPLLLCYQLGQLAGFYQRLLADILGPGAALSTTVAGCRDVANRCAPVRTELRKPATRCLVLWWMLVQGVWFKGFRLHALAVCGCMFHATS